MLVVKDADEAGEKLGKRWETIIQDSLRAAANVGSSSTDQRHLTCFGIVAGKTHRTI
jgi:hypothetical protein